MQGKEEWSEEDIMVAGKGEVDRGRRRIVAGKGDVDSGKERWSGKKMWWIEEEE